MINQRPLYQSNGSFHVGGPMIPFYILEPSASALDSRVIAEKESLITVINHKQQLNQGGNHQNNNNNMDLSLLNTSVITPTAGFLFNKIDFTHLSTDIEVMWESQEQFASTFPPRSSVGASMSMIASALGWWSYRIIIHIVSVRFAINSSLSLQGFIQVRYR